MAFFKLKAFVSAWPIKRNEDTQKKMTGYGKTILLWKKEELIKMRAISSTWHLTYYIKWNCFSKSHAQLSWPKYSAYFLPSSKIRSTAISYDICNSGASEIVVSDQRFWRFVFREVLSMYPNRFQQWGNKGISQKQSRLDIYRSNLIFLNLADFTSWQESTTQFSVCNPLFFVKESCNQIITNQASRFFPVLPQARIMEFLLGSGCISRRVVLWKTFHKLRKVFLIISGISR